MKKCPFCGEEIRDEAIKCRFCGEFLEEEKPTQEDLTQKSDEDVKSEIKEVRFSATHLIFTLILFFPFSLLFTFIILAFQTSESFPYLSLVVTVIGIVVIAWSIKLFRKKRNLAAKLTAVFIPFILLGGLYFYRGLNEYSEHKEKIIQTRLEKEKIRLEKKKREQEIQRLRQYNIVNKEEHYQKGLQLIKEKKYKESVEVLKKVTSVDDNYKNTKELINKTNVTITEIKNKERIDNAKQKIVEAGRLVKSNNCGDIQSAILLSESALNVLPDSKTAKQYLFQAKLNQLRCYEGNNKIKMAIQISSYQPLKLNVWIKNVSNEVRHANPNHFTLVTVLNRSYSVSSDTYGLSSYFDAVDLQPNTETSGYLIFNTWNKPRKLIYEEMLGISVSREFPFD